MPVIHEPFTLSCTDWFLDHLNRADIKLQMMNATGWTLLLKLLQQPWILKFKKRKRQQTAIVWVSFTWKGQTLTYCLYYKSVVTDRRPSLTFWWRHPAPDNMQMQMMLLRLQHRSYMSLSLPLFLLSTALSSGKWCVMLSITLLCVFAFLVGSKCF